MNAITGAEVDADTAKRWRVPPSCRLGGALLVAAIAGGCKGLFGHDDSSETTPSDASQFGPTEPSTFVDTFAQAPNDEVDILFMVDDSSDMAEEQQALADGFDPLIADLEATGTDFHLGLVTSTVLPGDPSGGALVGAPTFLTSDDPDAAAAFERRVIVGVDGDDLERGLGAVDKALSPAMQAGANAGFLRSEAQLLLVFVSTEDDCSDDFALDGQPAGYCYTELDALHPVDDYVEAWQNLKVDPAFVEAAAIVGLDDGCRSAHQGSRYLQAAQLTNAVVGDVCAADWTPTLSHIGLTGSSIKTEFILTYGAVQDARLEVRVDHDGTDQEPSDASADDELVEPGENDGWTYDPAAHSITFHGRAVPEHGAAITVSYDVDPS